MTATGTTLNLLTGVSGADQTATTTGGFVSENITTLARTDLCLSFRDASNSYYTLGCENVGALADQAATLSFVPQRSSPPASFVGPVSVVANGRDWFATYTLKGLLTVSACIRNTSADGAACRTTPTADPNVVTITCGATTTTLTGGMHGSNGATGANGADGMNGANGSNGVNATSATACSISDHGDGTATMTCPDGSSAKLLTPSAISNVKASGCNGGGDAGWGGLLAVLVLLAARRTTTRRSEQPA